MTKLSEKFLTMAQNIDLEPVRPESYFGVFIHRYRRKHHLSRTQMAIELGLEEDCLLRVEYGFSSRAETEFILSKIGPDKK